MRPFRFFTFALTALLCIFLLTDCRRMRCGKCDGMGGAAKGNPSGGGPGGGLPSGSAKPMAGDPEHLPNANDSEKDPGVAGDLRDRPRAGGTPTFTPTPDPDAGKLEDPSTPAEIPALDQFVRCPSSPAEVDTALDNLTKEKLDGTPVCTPQRISLMSCALTVGDDPNKIPFEPVSPPPVPNPRIAHLEKILLGTDGKCTVLGKSCGGVAFDEKGRTLAGYAIRFGHDQFARKFMDACGTLEVPSKSEPPDNALTAVLTLLAQKAKSPACVRPDVQLEIVNRLKSLYTHLLKGPPPFTAMTVEDATLQGGPPLFEMTLKKPPVAGTDAIRAAVFANGGRTSPPTATVNPRDTFTLLARINDECASVPAVRDEAFALFTELRKRGLELPPLAVPPKPGSFECFARQNTPELKIDENVCGIPQAR